VRTTAHYVATVSKSLRGHFTAGKGTVAPMPRRKDSNVGRVELNGGGIPEETSTMQKHVLMLTASTFILAYGAIAASAQQVPDVPTIQRQPQILQQRQELERQLRGAQTPRRGIEDDLEDDGGMKGWRYGPDWRHHESWRRGAMGPGMMDQGGMMGPGNRGSGMMMRMLFSLMDSDGDGTISLQEFQAAQERIFKAMDANKDGRLTLEEIQAFIQGARRSVPRQ
jgi:hypothetical protein